MLGENAFHSINIEQILNAVSKKIDVSKRLIKGKSRRKEYVRGRQIVMYLSRELTRLPLSTIGIKVGRRDHSTVVHACKAIENKMKSDISLKQLINELLETMSKKY